MELIIALAIAGIMAAMGIPGFIKWLPDYRLKQVAQGLFADMQHTRMLAVKTGIPHAIFFDVANNRYFLCSQKGPDNTWETCEAQHRVKQVDFTGISSSITYGYGQVPVANPGDGVTYQNNTLVFNPRGIGSAGYVYLSSPVGTCCRAGTQSSGIVLLRRWDGSAWK